MEIELTTEESAAVQAALRSYVADLRMEIVDTDNAQYKRTLRDERAALEGVIAKLDASASQRADDAPVEAVRVVRLVWSVESG